VKVEKKLREVVWRLVEGDNAMDDFVVSKSLKNTYKGTQPSHAVVADKIRQRIAAGKTVREPPKSGDRIPFVIINGASDKVRDRAEDPTWVVEKGLVLDRTYYLEKQLEKPLTTLTSYFCDAGAIFARAKAEIWRQDAKNARITEFFAQEEEEEEPKNRSAASTAAAAAAPVPPPAPPKRKQRTLGGKIAAPPAKRSQPPKPCARTRKGEQMELKTFFA